MANIISDETIEYVGILAKLELSPEEKEQAKKGAPGVLAERGEVCGLDCGRTPAVSSGRGLCPRGAGI